jgi:hypothetical protein
MLKRLIRITAEIPVLAEKSAEIEADWSSKVNEPISRILNGYKVTAAECWDFANAFVLDIEGFCGGMDTACVIELVRAFGVRVASGNFVLNVFQDGNLSREDKVLKN